MQTEIWQSADPLFRQHLQHLMPVPERLYYSGPLLELLKRPRVAVVGSRKISSYGQAVINQLVPGLVQAGVVIISGLAIGVDAAAHRATLNAGGQTIAVLPGPLEQVYPANHRRLAEQIIVQGGALVSEYEAAAGRVQKWQFIARNRIIAGLTDAVLVPEAAINSGSRHTVVFGRELQKEILAVPGSILSQGSAGPNQHIMEGALLALETADILQAIGVSPAGRLPPSATGLSPPEQTILNLIRSGAQDTSQLLSESQLDISQLNQATTALEIEGLIRPAGPYAWAST